jgi:predicted nucleic acid-binding protein
MAFILVDTGVWLALCDSNDGTVDEDKLEEIYSKIKPHSIVIPWPVAYETLRTRFVRNRLAMERFEREIKSPGIVLFDDAPYRDEAINLCLESSLRRGRPMSMVDCLMRLVLEDPATKISYLVTFNLKDFADVCRARRIELWSHEDDWHSRS